MPICGGCSFPRFRTSRCSNICSSDKSNSIIFGRFSGGAFLCPVIQFPDL